MCKIDIKEHVDITTIIKGFVKFIITPAVYYNVPVFKIAGIIVAIGYLLWDVPDCVLLGVC